MDFDSEGGAATDATRDFMRFLSARHRIGTVVSAGRYLIALLERLKSRAFSEDLWNLFLPG
jgi:acyl-CoA dehydrogenase